MDLLRANRKDEYGYEKKKLQKINYTFAYTCNADRCGRLWKAAELMLRVSRWKNKLKHRFDRKKECAEPMKKSCLIAVVAVLAAVAGALGAVAVYLRRREKELDEYERLLFGEDDAATVEDTAEPAEAAEEAPAEDKAE